MNITENQFFESLNWHDGSPPQATDEETDGDCFYTLITKTVVAIKDKEGNFHHVGRYNYNLCESWCDNCNTENPTKCMRDNEIVAWAEFYK
jgi:hypothetical protein